MKKIILASTVLASLLSFGANAAILGANTASGLDLRNGKTESNSVVAYNEKKDVNILANSVFADYITDTNMFTGVTYSGVTTSKSGLTIQAGIYDSHIIHFDPLGKKGGIANNANGTTTATTFTFDSDIIAVIVGTQYLNASDVDFGNAAAYNNGNDRRFEAHDLFTFTADNILTVDLAKVSSKWIDNIRVITNASAHVKTVAEPTSIALIGLGLVAIAGLRKRQK